MYTQHTIKGRYENRKRGLYITGVVQTSRQVELPYVPIHEPSLQSLAPLFSIISSPAINDRSVQLADIVPRVRVVTSCNRLIGELVLGCPDGTRLKEFPFRTTFVVRLLGRFRRASREMY